MKLSQWHDGSVKPFHVGIYQICPDDLAYSYFDGNNFGYMWFLDCCNSDHQIAINNAYRDRNISIEHFNEKWRGIVKDKK